MSEKGWTVVAGGKKKKVMVDVPRCEFVDWDDDARKLFVLMREIYPNAASAQELAKKMGEDFNKMNIGDLLYGDELNPYVERIGKPPNRKWRVKSVE